MDATGLELGTRCQRSQKEIRTAGYSMWALGHSECNAENLVRAVQHQGCAASEEDAELWCAVLANYPEGVSETNILNMIVLATQIDATNETGLLRCNMQRSFGVRFRCLSGNSR